MSSELERLLREARDALPAPDEPSTQRARARAVSSLRRKRRRARAVVVVVAMLVAAVAFGVTAGSLNPPSVTAAREPALLGFVPEPGWLALQSPPPAVEGQQMLTVAANVAIAADDVDNGLVEPSGLPYSTLLTLPPDGIVIVVTMTPLWDPHVAPVPPSSLYPHLELPLQLRDAVPREWWGGAQVRPDEPLAQYQLSGEIGRVNADVTIYFGTARPSSEQRAAAQRQLNGFVIRPDRVDAMARPPTVATPSRPVAVIDRTFACNTKLLGGLYRIESRAHSGYHVDGAWLKLPFAGVFSGGNAGALDNSVPPSSALAWVTAGTPKQHTTVDNGWDAFSVATGGTLGRNTELCRPSTTRVPLVRAGLRGGEVGRDLLTVDCDAPKRVLIRIRATALGNAVLRERGRVFAATSSPITRAELAVRTPAGKQLVYATVDQSGRSRQYTAPRICVVEP